MSFSNFNLNKNFIKSIEAAGYESPTELQSQLIPLVAEKKSALIWSQSASGKTGAFLIPAMNYILDNPAPEKRGARILILTSRRDRVSQINYTIKRLSNDLVMRFGFIVSGRPYQTQMRLMRRPLDIMIATPGRLNDLMNNGKADFSQLEMLIIDDLTSIYNKNLQGLVEKILEQAGTECSAITFVREDEDVSPYAKSLFSNAEEITVNEENEELEPVEVIQREQQKPVNKKNNNKVKIDPDKLIPQKVYIADDYTHKIAMMDYLMDEFSGEATLIYTNTNKSAKILQENLANHGHAADLIDDVQIESLEESDILIVSDQAKTKIPADTLSQIDKHIINFELPNRTDAYLARLSAHDQSREEATLIMIDGFNFNELKHLEKTLDSKITQATIPGLEPLKPFVNLSKNKPKTHNKGKKQQKDSNKRNAKNKRNNQTKQQRNKNKSQAQANNNQQKRQHKGQFGRLNGGTHRKNTGREKKIGVSSRGTAAPKGDRAWQSDFAEPKERKPTNKKPVAIRYSKKKSFSRNDKPEEIE